MSKKIWILAISLIGTFLLLNLYNSLPEKKIVSNPDSIITIAYSNWAGWWPWAIAEQEGFFADRNLQVELVWYDDYSKSLTDLAAGYIDGNCQTLSDTIIRAANTVKGETVVLITDSSMGNDKIMARTGIDTVGDLKGKVISVEGGTNDFLLALSLNKYGLSLKDVNILAAETGAGVEAFVAGQSDAVRAFPPYWYNALKKKGAHEIASSAEFPEQMFNLLVVTQDLVDRHPDKVQALIDTWFDILDFTVSNLERSDEILAQRAGVSLQTVKLLKSGTQMYRLQDNLDSFSQGKSVPRLSSATKEVANFLQLNLKSIQRSPNISRLLNSQFIKIRSNT